MAQIPESTRRKIDAQKRAAPSELPKARLCGDVVAAFMSGEGKWLDESVASMKAGLGNHWALLRAFQYMSGAQALFAAQCASGEEKAALVLVHKVASSASEAGLLTNAGLAQLRAFCVTASAASKAST